MRKPFDILTREGLERACNEFEEMGKELTPIGQIMLAATVAQFGAQMESEIDKGKRPPADLSFREFFNLLAWLSSTKEKESENEQ